MSQLDELIDDLRKERECEAAAKTDLDELTLKRNRLEHEICEVERKLKIYGQRVEAAWRLVRHRIFSQTDTTFESDGRDQW